MIELIRTKDILELLEANKYLRGYIKSLKEYVICISFCFCSDLLNMSDDRNLHNGSGRLFCSRVDLTKK